jgi:hypothetical protein
MLSSGGGRMLAFLEDGSSLRVVQDDVKFMGLIRESPVVEEDIGSFLPTYLSGNTDGFAMRHVRGKRWQRIRIWRQ